MGLKSLPPGQRAPRHSRVAVLWLGPPPGGQPSGNDEPGGAYTTRGTTSSG